MKLSTLLVLVGVGVALVLGMWVINREPSRPEDALSAGDRLIPFDMNLVAGLEIKRGTNQTKAIYRDGRWIVPDAYDYPADFNRLAGELRNIAQLRIGQVIRGGEELLHEFGLDPDAGSEIERPTLVLTFLNDAGDRLGHLQVGRIRQTESDPRQPMFASENAYMRMNEGPVVLMTEALRQFPSTSDQLIQSRLFELTSDDIQSVHLQHRSGDEIEVAQDSAGEFSALHLKEDEELNTSRVRQWFNAFRFIELAKVAGPRHETIERAFLDSFDRLTIQTQDDRQIELQIGEPSAEGPRYLQVSIRHPEDGTAHQDHTRWEGWTLTLPTHLHTQLIVEREELIISKGTDS